MRIIVAEDEERSRRGITALISSFGPEYEVIAQAVNGKSALELIRKLKPDAVFTDIRMPYMDGLELIETVRAEGISSRFVIISAHEEFALAQKAMKLGVREYILKPITIEDIDSALRQIFHAEPQPLLRPPADMHPVVRHAMAEMEIGYAEKISLEQIAIRHKVTPEYFSYIFARDAGMKWSAYLKQLRIEAAKALLWEGREKTAEVARKVGFLDAKYFCRVFKEATGVTPGEYMRHITSDVKNIHSS